MISKDRISRSNTAKMVIITRKVWITIIAVYVSSLINWKSPRATSLDLYFVIYSSKSDLYLNTYIKDKRSFVVILFRISIFLNIFLFSNSFIFFL